MAQSGFWAITSYFNLGRDARRLSNYCAFRHHLGLPLVTVEWSPEGEFQLGAGDAEILVQLSGGDAMWQKERLLNVALERLPADCTAVAALDCDVVFERADWREAAERLLTTSPFVQLFGEAWYVSRRVPATGVAIDALSAADPEGVAVSLSYLLETGNAGDWSDAGLMLGRRPGLQGSTRLRRGSPGLAWAMRRDVIARSGFYDRNVIGGGDRILALGASADAERFIAIPRSGPAHERDIQRYLACSPTAREANLRHLPGRIFHLWHGALSGRHYGARHALLADTEFDPEAHLVAAGNGAWAWSATAPERARAVVGTYMRERQRSE